MKIHYNSVYVIFLGIQKCVLTGNYYPLGTLKEKCLNDLIINTNFFLDIKTLR